MDGGGARGSRLGGAKEKALPPATWQTSGRATMTRVGARPPGACRIDEKPHPGDESPGWGHLNLHRFPNMRRRSLFELRARYGGFQTPGPEFFGFFLSAPRGPSEGVLRPTGPSEGGSSGPLDQPGRLSGPGPAG
jgi:hypothetical protein